MKGQRTWLADGFNRTILKEVLLEIYGGCIYCERVLTVEEATLDHIQPVFLYPHLKAEASNLMPCCETCNRIRDCLPFEVFCTLVGTDWYFEMNHAYHSAVYRNRINEKLKKAGLYERTNGEEIEEGFGPLDQAEDRPAAFEPAEDDLPGSEEDLQKNNDQVQTTLTKARLLGELYGEV